VDGFVRRGIQRPRLPSLRRLELPDRLGEDSFHGTDSLSFILAAGLDLDGCAHRSAKRQDAEDICRVPSPLSTAQEHDRPGPLHCPCYASRHGSSDSRMG